MAEEEEEEEGPATQEDDDVGAADAAAAAAAAEERALPRTLLSAEDLAGTEAAEALAARKRKDSFVAQALQQQQQQKKGTAAAAASAEEEEAALFLMLPEPPRGGRVVVFDVETSGFGACDGVVEIGAVELVDGVRTGALFQTYCRPPCAVHPLALAVHALSDAFLREAPPARFAVASFADWAGDAPLVAHNAAFDLRMLAREYARAGLPLLSQRRQQRMAFCTMQHFRRRFPGRPFALGDMASALLLPPPQQQQQQQHNRQLQQRAFAHGALLDAEILASCFQQLLRLSPSAAGAGAGSNLY